MARDSVFTQEEKESIEIKRLIFHIILQDDFRPAYLEEVILTEDQKKFFKNRLIDSSEGSQYVFANRENSDLYNNCRLLLDGEENFISSSKRIAAMFHSHHSGSTSDGVFVITTVEIINNRKLIFLIKLDHKRVYEYKLTGNRALLEEITNTFVEDKKALQKVAVVDIDDNYAWDILATDRTGSGGIRDYFRSFLGVVDRDSPYRLTEKAVRFTLQWAKENRTIIDPRQDIASYKSRAVSYLNSHELFDSNEFVDSVLYDEDLSRKDRLKESFTSFLTDKGLVGQVFHPSQNALNRRTVKNVRQTSEGLKLEWEGDEKDVNIDMPNQPNSNDGLYHIMIKTSDIKIIS